MERERILKLINEASNELQIKEKIKLRIRPMKRKIASISFLTKILVLNKNFIENSSEIEIKYVIFHELLHLKHGKFHTPSFKHELKSFFPEDLEKEVRFGEGK